MLPFLLYYWRMIFTQNIVANSKFASCSCLAVGGSVEPWAMWFHDQPPNRQRVEDRQQTREEREEERRRKLMEQQREEARRKREEEEQIRRREQEMRRKFQREKQKESEQIAALEIELERERTQRASAEKRKDEVIARLQAELARYRAPSAHTPASIPPSSSHSVPSVREPTQMEPTSQPSISPRQDAQELLRDLLRGTLRSLDLGKKKMYPVSFLSTGTVKYAKKRESTVAQRSCSRSLSFSYQNGDFKV